MRLSPIAFAVFCVLQPAFAASSMTGQAGILNMPDGRVEEDGTFALGYTFDRPYSTLWTNLTVLPFLQMNGRFVAIRGIPGFSSAKQAASYGSYKDKVIDLKLRLLQEGQYLPEVSFGKTDLLGTQLFDGQYIAASKRLGPVDATLGYGSGKIQGLLVALTGVCPTMMVLGHYWPSTMPIITKAIFAPPKHLRASVRPAPWLGCRTALVG